MRYLNYDDKIIRILESLYRDTISAVRVDGGLSGWIDRPYVQYGE